MAVVREFITAVPVGLAETVEIRNPANLDEVVGAIPRITPADIDKLVLAADAAKGDWTRRTPQERFDLITAALAEADTAGLDVLLTRENGKVLSDSTREVQYLSYPVSFLAPLIPWLTDGDDLGDNGRHHTKVYRQPFGVVGVIIPWNAPIGQSIITLAPALLAGNAVVALLPATCPLAILQVFGALARALPKGVLTLLASPDPAVPKALIEHPWVRNVHFTGSTTIGTVVAREGSGTITSLTLELGGNDAAVALDDAFQGESVYAKWVAAAFGFCGQACVALKRLYVPRSRVEQTLEGLAQILDATVVGNGLDPATTLGPVHNARGRDRVRRLIEEARAAGGTVHEFGMMNADPDKGYFLRPAVVTGLGNDASLVREEQFGPVLPIIAYDSVEEAIALANDSEYGLGGSVWSADVDRAAKLALELETGMVWINAHSGAGIDGRAPWGGFKSSGVGRGGSNRAGLEGFTEPKIVTIPTA